MGYFRNLLFIIVMFLVFTLRLSADTEVDGPVNGVWELEGSPYIVIDNITIEDQDSLEIEPGVEVHFNNTLTFFVYGRLNASGNEGDSIVFRTIPDGEAWGGIRFLDSDSLTRLDYCAIFGGRVVQGEGEPDSASSGGNIYIYQGMVSIENSRISNGHARSYGGGVAIHNSTALLRNCLISDNGPSMAGGGLAIWENSNPTIENCLLTRNETQSSGGGIFIAILSEPSIFGCDLVENEVTGRNSGGGGMYISALSDAVIEKCSFQGNFASGEGSDGGALTIRDNAGSPELRNCTFTSNRSSDSGGALYIRGEGSNPLIEKCVFTQNTITNGDRDGGAVFIRLEAGPEIRYCQFVGNVADWGGALSVMEPPRGNIHHNLFWGNGSRLGGAAIATASNLDGVPLVITNSTFIHQHYTGLNATPLTANPRGNSRVVLSSCIVWDEEPRFNNEELVDVSFSNILDGYDGEENSDEYPRFLTKDSLSFLALLRGDSPCIDSGDPGLGEDPDESNNDRGWMYFPNNAIEGLTPDVLSAELTTIDRETVTLSFENATSAPLYVTPMDYSQPEIRDAFVNLTNIIGDSEINGVALTNEGIFVSGSYNGRNPNRIYCFDRDINFRSNFDQPGDRGDIGYLDLATDGEQVLFGANDRQINEFTTEGEVGEIVAIQYEQNPVIEYVNALAVDWRNAEIDLDFYIGGEEGFIVRTNLDRWERDRIQVESEIQGLAMKWNSRVLYMVTQSEDGKVLLSQVYTDTHEIIPLYNLRIPENYRIGGIDVTQNWNEGYGTLAGIFKGDGDDGDVLFIENIYTSWLIIKPEPKLVFPGETVEWDIIIAADQMGPGQFVSTFDFVINEIGEPAAVAVFLESTQSGISGSVCIAPENFILNSPFPNPFNSTTGFSYHLPHRGLIDLFLLDIQGRKVLQLGNSVEPAGFHHVSLHGENLPSGRYLILLNYDGQVSIKPLTLLR